MKNKTKIAESRTKWPQLFRDTSKEGIKSSFFAHLKYTLAKDRYSATLHDAFLALSTSVRDRIVQRWIRTQQKYHKNNVRRIYYFSLEFLIGRLLGNNIFNLGLESKVPKVLSEAGYSLEEIREQEMDAGLGNGGLGRLAACFLDSMATLRIPAHGYGIRYDYGIFHQKIEDGYQVELPDEWLRLGNPWEFRRPEYTVKVRFYGRTVTLTDKRGRRYKKWVDTEDVLAVPYDLPVPGYKNDVVNTLRLWSANSTEDFDLDYFNHGDYEQAVYKKIFSENISKVLYPNDNIREGRELRLKQEYFFTAASIADLMRRFVADNSDIRDLPEKICIQLNDTHPSLAIVELMRILLDDHRLDWHQAWDISRRIFAYTNHTLMPEALECWSVLLMEKILPRHLQIIYEINARFLEEVSEKYPGDLDKIRRMSLVEEGSSKRVRMANLCIVGSFSVNGVSELHSKLLREVIFRDFHEFYPQKFNNKTNGITQRRWLLKANPELSGLITKAIGDNWVTDLSHLEKLHSFLNDKGFRRRWKEIKENNKKTLAQYIYKTNNVLVDSQSLFDVQVKRMHEYKRQLLFGFYMLSQYLKIKNDPQRFICPRTFIMGGKAAPGYYMAKLVIKFINSIADVINRDKVAREKVKVIFLPNYRVSLAEKIFPASDLSEQISLAGTEASGTGNMKFMLNGALTIGTLDGANIEMKQFLGDENIFIFGLRADEVKSIKERGYSPTEYIEKSNMLREIFSLIRKDFLSPRNQGLFKPILDSLESDPFMVCADFDAYFNMQEEISRHYLDSEWWTEKSIINTSRSGNFSSDRTIREYAKDIWNIDYK
ncbi:MAG: glycogen/starch/alpha-glucan family phosphorylase [Candidatus Omnitrophica bacterium]|nr:glycogen/starch/alpha-glucan family phosphorylase [Candidatus Omnitrophota bacterium]MBD3269341.1 glycogen/starch/alpha-glucan family phosphorylase [Candidatus Omnitrophota bacterium]